MTQQTQWEYARLINPTLEQVNVLGKDGWELCGRDSFGFWFKRILGK